MYDLIDLDNSLALRTSEGQLLNVQIKEVALDRLDKFVKNCNLTFAVPARVYKNIEATKLFGLDGEIGEEFVPEGLDDDKEVEIEVGLKRELIIRLFQEASDRAPDDEDLELAGLVARYLLQLGDNLAESPFLLTDNWYALYVQQEVPIPKEMGEGSLKMGGKTVWGHRFEAEAEKEDLEEEDEGEIFTVMAGFFEEQELNYQSDEDDGVIVLSIPGEPGTWNCYCEADEEQRTCKIYSVFPLKAKPEKYAAISELLMRINYRVSIGNFEMGYETGEIRFRTSIDLEGDRFSKALMKQLFVGNIFKVEQYYNSILMVLIGEATPEEAIDNPELSLT
ncbi:MAG: YbjN domain-containing protein [Cyanobacteria bacterium P01_E01_bin.42]